MTRLFRHDQNFSEKVVMYKNLAQSLFDISLKFKSILSAVRNDEHREGVSKIIEWASLEEDISSRSLLTAMLYGRNSNESNLQDVADPALPLLVKCSDAGISCRDEDITKFIHSDFLDCYRYKPHGVSRKGKENGVTMVFFPAGGIMANITGTHGYWAGSPGFNQPFSPSHGNEGMIIMLHQEGNI